MSEGDGARNGAGEGGGSGEDGGGFRDVASIADLPAGAKIARDVCGKSVLVCNAGGEIHAVANECTHAGVPRLPGRLRGCVLECPLHGGKFDVRDGRPVAGPPRHALACYEVRIAGGRVAVRVGTTA